MHFIFEACLNASSYNSIFFTFVLHCVAATKGFLYKSWIFTYKVFICIHRSNIDCLMDYMYAYLARTYYISTMTKIVAQLLLHHQPKHFIVATYISIKSYIWWTNEEDYESISASVVNGPYWYHQWDPIFMSDKYNALHPKKLISA